MNGKGHFETTGRGPEVMVSLFQFRSCGLRESYQPDSQSFAQFWSSRLPCPPKRRTIALACLPQVRSNAGGCRLNVRFAKPTTFSVTLKHPAKLGRNH